MSRLVAFCRRFAVMCSYSLLFLALSAAGPELGAPFDRTPGLQESTAPFDRTPGFDVACAMSFYLVDYCGDFLLGELWRNALVEKLAQCPFTEAARKRFRELAVINEAQARSTIGRYWEEHKGPMEYLSDTKRNCAEARAKPELVEVRRRLARFAAGEISVDEALPMSCADGATPGGP
jgi:hypothetical protein